MAGGAHELSAGYEYRSERDPGGAEHIASKRFDLLADGVGRIDGCGLALPIRLECDSTELDCDDCEHGDHDYLETIHPGEIRRLGTAAHGASFEASSYPS